MNSSIDSSIDIFLEAKRHTVSIGTLRKYALAIRLYKAFINRWPPTATDVLRFIEILRARMNSDYTVNSYFRSLCAWFNWLADEGHLDRSPTQLVDFSPGQPPILIGPAKNGQPTSDHVADPWDAAISLYLKAQRQAGLSKSTVGYYDARPLIEQGCSELGKYGWHLRELARWARQQGVRQPEELSRNALLEWGAYKAERWQKTTQRQAVFAYRSFFGWLVEEGRMEQNPALVLKAPNAKKAKVRRTLTREEIELLFIACRTSEPDAVRSLALISLMIDTGLRSSETCSLKISSLHFKETRPGFSEPFNFLTVRIKGGDERIAYYSDTTAFRLTRWIDLRKMFVRGNDDGLFLSIGGNRPGRKITPSGLRVIFRKLAKRAGIRHFSPHALRRSMTVLAIQAGANTRVVQEMGRWSDIKMVEHYSKAFQVGPVFKKFSPVNFVNQKEQTADDTAERLKRQDDADDSYTFTVELPEGWE